MVGGWRYRLAGIAGTVVLIAAGLAVVNHPLLQVFLATEVPVLNRLQPVTLTNGRLFVAYLTALVIFLGAFFPLYKPSPRRILDTVLLVQKRVLVGVLALATVGYFDYTYRLPRTTVILAGLTFGIVFPLWFVWIRRRPAGGTNAILIGDDPTAMLDIFEETNGSLRGYVSPVIGRRDGFPLADGGQVHQQTRPAERVSDSLPRLGGLSQLDGLLREYDVDTAYLAFASSDRAEFFGTLDKCYEYGVAVKVHREHTDNVLTNGGRSGPIVDVELEPLDLQDHVLKRGFDIGFSLVGLLLTAPLWLLIAVAIRLDDGGPIFYEQERTAEFGQSFSVFKFRSMTPEGESAEPIADAENDRITRVGGVIRDTHLDELPQLLTILQGRMSVVGPRAVWREEETVLQAETDRWRQRWFVKPGLTGLAQIRDQTSEDPLAKLRSDLEYIRRQSFWFDLKIVIRQLWDVFVDVGSYLRGTLVRS